MLASPEPHASLESDPILLDNIVYAVRLGPHNFDRISLLQAYLFQGGVSSDEALLRSVAQLASALQDGREVMVQSPLNRQFYSTNFFVDESNPEPFLPCEEGSTYVHPFEGRGKLITALIAHDLISDRALAEYCRRNTLSDLPNDFFNSFKILSIDTILGVLFAFGFVKTLSEIISKSSSCEDKVLASAEEFIPFFPDFVSVAILNKTLGVSFKEKDYKRHAETVFAWLCAQATRDLTKYRCFFNVRCIKGLREMRWTDLLWRLLQHAKKDVAFQQAVENSIRQEWGDDSFAHYTVSLYESGQDQRLLTLLYDMDCSISHRKHRKTVNIVHYAGFIHNFEALKWLGHKREFRRFFFKQYELLNRETFIHAICGGCCLLPAPMGFFRSVTPEQHHADKQKEARSFLTWCTHAFGGLLRSLFRKRDGTGRYASFRTVYSDNSWILSWFAESGGFFEASITDHGPEIAEAAACLGSVSCLDFLLQRSKQPARFCLADPALESRPYQALFAGQKQRLWDKAGEENPSAKAAIQACLKAHGMKPR